MKGSLLILFMITFGSLKAQFDVGAFVHFSDSMMIDGIDQSRIPGAILGIASSDSIYLLKGYGLSDYEKQIEVDPEHTLFQLGSVGKIFTSIALLQQVKKGNINLDDDVNKFLDGWKIKNPYNEPVTPFHLLTHTAGFNDQNINYLARNNEEVEPLAQHLARNMPSLFQPPGTEINYSNYSYALAGHLVEKITGKEFENQIQTSIFNPLSMVDASYYVPDNYQEHYRFANGYRLRDTFIPVKMYPRHAKPAGSIVATGMDMLIFSQALLKRDPALLNNEGYNLLFNQQFTNHPKLLGYSIGMEVQNYGGIPAYAKGGMVTGFLSALVVIPDLDLTIFLSTNTQTDNHFEHYFKSFQSKFFPSRNVDTLSQSFDIEDFIGSYTNERANHETIEEFFALFRGHLRIYESNSGNLSAFHNGAWHEYQYLGEDVFQDLSDPYNHIVFKRVNGQISKMYRSFNTGGILIPASYRKVSWFERPRFLNDEYPFALTILPTYLMLPFIWLFTYFIRKKKPDFLSKSKVLNYYHFAAFAFLGFFIWNIVGFFIPLIKLGEQMTLGFPKELSNMKYVHWLMACVAVMLIILTAKLWVKKESNVLFRLYFTLFSVVAISYILILHRWHFMNVTI